MKQVTIVTTLLLTINLMFGQLPGETKWKENLAKNHVHTQVQWNHKYKQGKPVKEGYKNFTKSFDHNGNVIEEIYYQSGNIDQKLSYKYDNNDNQVEYVNYKGNESKVMFKQNITYDNSGRKIREERYNGTDYQIIKYNYKNNKLAEIIRSDVFGNIEHKRIFTYTGNICTINIYDGETTQVGKIINTYDEHDNIIKSIEYDVDGNEKEKYVYSFTNNLMQEKTKYVLGNFRYKEEYTYDENNNLIKVIKEEPQGKTLVNNIYRYDSEGKLIEEEWYDNNPNENSKKTYYYSNDDLLERVEVYYALYKYRIQYQFEYTYY